MAKISLCVCLYINIGLARKFVWPFLYSLTEKNLFLSLSLSSIYTCTHITSSYTSFLLLDPGCFHALAIVNSFDVNIEVLVSFQLEFLFFPGICPRVKLLDHMVALLLVFREPPLFPKLAAPIHISTNSVGWFPFPCTLSSIYYL